MDITFGGLGDLPDYLCGGMTGRGSSVDSRDVIDGGCTDLSKVWADRKDGQLELIVNSGPMADLPAGSKKNDVDRQKIIRDAQRLLMKGGSRDQLNQFLSLAFDGRPAPDDPQIQALYERGRASWERFRTGMLLPPVTKRKPSGKNIKTTMQTCYSLPPPARGVHYSLIAAP